MRRKIIRPTNRPTDMRRNTRKHCGRMFWDHRFKPSAITIQMWVQSDPSLLCGQETFIKSGPPTLPAKQIQIDQIVLNLVTHYGFKAAGARKGAQNSFSFLDRSCGEKNSTSIVAWVSLPTSTRSPVAVWQTVFGLFFLDKTLTCPLSRVARETTWYELPESKSQKNLVSRLNEGRCNHRHRKVRSPQGTF